jgi:hypothetical protein
MPNFGINDQFCSVPEWCLRGTLNEQLGISLGEWETDLAEALHQ